VCPWLCTFTFSVPLPTDDLPPGKVPPAQAQFFSIADFPRNLFADQRADQFPLSNNGKSRNPPPKNAPHHPRETPHQKKFSQRKYFCSKEYTFQKFFSVIFLLFVSAPTLSSNRRFSNSIVPPFLFFFFPAPDETRFKLFGLSMGEFFSATFYNKALVLSFFDPFFVCLQHDNNPRISLSSFFPPDFGRSSTPFEMGEPFTSSSRQVHRTASGEIRGLFVFFLFLFFRTPRTPNL